MANKKKLKTLLIMSVFLVATACRIAAGDVIYVDDDASIGGNGQSWGTAYKYLQDALADATSGDEIWVANGTYKPDQGSGQTPGDRTATFQLINGVAIKGGYAGFGVGEPNERNVESYETILSGDLDGNDVPVSDPCDLLDEPTRAENGYHVVTGSGTDDTAVLDGFTLTAGNANGAYADRNGGGMYNNNGSPTLTDCTLSGNSAGSLPGGGLGGGMYNKNQSSPVLVMCIFTGNWAAWGGGGMYNYEGKATLANCTFTRNSAGTIDGGEGGGMLNVTSNPTLTDCTFSGNVARALGGGMRNCRQSSPTLTNCTFTGNSASGGGGMSNDDSSPTLTNCTFSGNSGDGGGMFNQGNSSPTVTNCAFSGNRSVFGGGGMYNYGNSNPALTNCTFIGNSAGEGAGIYNFISSPKLTNCTFTGNWAYGSGGGMHNQNSNVILVCNPTVTNCTFSGNSATNGTALACDSYHEGYPSNLQITNCILFNVGTEIWNNDGSTITITYSDIQGGQTSIYDPCEGLVWGTGNIDADPLFVDPDGPDGIAGTEDDNLRLSGGSPCIDAGDNTAVPIYITTDLNGSPRFFDDPNVADTGSGDPPLVDMGAYERNIPSGGGVCGDAYHPYPTGDLNRDCHVDFYDFAVFCIHWLECTAPECD